MQTTIAALAISLLALSGYSDWRNRRIPNKLCLAIAALGLAGLFVAGDPLGAAYTVGVTSAIFCAAFILFACGVFGGGDAKLIAATVLLIGYRHLMDFLFIMSLFGAVLGIFALARARFGPWLEHLEIGMSLSKARFVSASIAEGPPESRLGAIPRAAMGGGSAGPAVTSASLTVPYGVAVAAAGIVTLIIQTYLTR